MPFCASPLIVDDSKQGTIHKEFEIVIERFELAVGIPV